MKFAQFLKDESGAITVDWVILTAAIVGIAIAVLIAIAGGLHNGASATSGTAETANTAIASLIGGLGNLGDYTLTGSWGSHSHYSDSEGNNYTVDGGVMTNDSGGVVGTVDEAGNITPV